MTSLNHICTYYLNTFPMLKSLQILMASWKNMIRLWKYCSKQTQPRHDNTPVDYIMEHCLTRLLSRQYLITHNADYCIKANTLYHRKDVRIHDNVSTQQRIEG